LQPTRDAVRNFAATGPAALTPCWSCRTDLAEARVVADINNAIARQIDLNTTIQLKALCTSILYACHLEMSRPGTCEPRAVLPIITVCPIDQHLTCYGKPPGIYRLQDVSSPA
jgi:hypothetical protein